MKTSKAFIPLLVLFIVVVWGASAVSIFMWFGAPNSPGVVGDTFGAINALFSGLALAGVVYTLILQRQDLELQIAEQANSRRELSEQSRLMAEQLATMKTSFGFEHTRAMIAAQPRLRLSHVAGNRISRIVNFTNVGGPITNLTAVATEGCTVTINPRQALQNNEGLVLDVQRVGAPDFPRQVYVTIQYTDSLGFEGALYYRITLDAQNSTAIEPCAAPHHVVPERND